MLSTQKTRSVMRITRLLLTTSLFILLGNSLTAHAQTLLSGHIVDSASGEPIPGANIYVDNTSEGSVSDTEGLFNISVSSLPVRLTFSVLGYTTTTRHVVEASSSMEIVLRATNLDMDPLLVSANRELQPRSEIPVSISAISATQIDASAPNMLYEVFNQVAGVHMASLSNEQYKLSIRQPLTNKAYFLFMEDGIPLRPIGVFNPNALINVNMAGAERIEILRGPSSAMNGGNAVAGSINFISTRPTAVPDATFGLRRDNYGYTRADFSGSTVRGKTGVAIGGYVARQRDGWYEHSDFDKVSLTARLDRQIDERTRLINTASYSNMDTDTNGALDSLSYASRGFNSLHTFSYRQMESLRVRSTIERSWSESQRSTLTVFFRDNTINQLPYWRVRGVRGNRAKATGETNIQSFWSLGLLGQQEWRFETLDTKLNAGFSLDRSPATYIAEWIDVDRDSDGTYASFVAPDSMLSDYSVGIFNAAGYIRAEVQPVANLRVSSSVRLDQIQYDYDNHLSTDAYSSAPDEVTSFSHISPKLGLTYDFGGGRGLYSNISLGFAPPEISEMYHGVSVPSLEPATFQSMEIGGWAALLGGKLFVDASLYSMTGKNEIIPIVSPTGGFVNENAGHTEHRGIEYTVLVLPIESISIRLTGSQSTHEFVEFVDFGVDQSGNDMAFAPSWTANGEIAYKPSFLEGARISAEWNHLGNYFMDNANTTEYEGYDLFNLRAAYRKGPVQVWGNLANVFDTLHATNAAAYAWGSIYNVGQVRAATIGLRYNLK